MIRRSLFLIIIFAISLTPLHFLNAQLVGVNLAELTITPKQPGPNETVIARLESYVTKLDLSDISWSINGQSIASGQGIKTISFKTGMLGTKTTVEAMVISSEGYSTLKSLTIYPAKADILFEAESYTPPFYKGKAYFPYQGSARLTAVPSFVDENGKIIPSSQLLFTWKENDRLMRDASGVGRNVFNYKSGILSRTVTINVEVSSQDLKYFAKSSIDIEPIEPKIVLYEEHPEYGVMYNKALPENFDLKNDNLKITAIPFFFTTDDPNRNGLSYEWNINGSPMGNSGNTLTLKKPKDAEGLSYLSLQVNNSINIFQFAQKDLYIKFK